MKRGPKPKGKVKIKWSADFAYAIGLIVTDGCIGRKGGHIDFTSKDIEQVENFKKCLDIRAKIGFKKSKEGFVSRRIQFRDQFFHAFLLDIGIGSAKSKTIGEINVPRKYFFDFLRGCFDGDGCFYSYWDPRWRSSHMFYLEFVSASKKHIDWLKLELKKQLGILGHVTNGGVKSICQLKYAKKEAIEIIKKIYYNQKVVCLSRKRVKVEKALNIEKQQQNRYRLAK
jgi:hypothetical protein